MTKALWQIETEGYLPRLGKLRALHDEAVARVRGIPPLPLSESVEPKLQATIVLGVFALSGMRVVQLILDALVHQWSMGMLICVSMDIRLMLEYRAAISFGLSIAERLYDEAQFGKAYEHSMRLTTGSKTPIKLPWGEMSTIKSFSTMEFIRHLDEREKGALRDYEFLCEASHPNAMQHLYFVMASKTYDNWSNDAFKKHAHETLARCVSICESTVEGIAIDAIKVDHLCAERFHHAPKIVPGT